MWRNGFLVLILGLLLLSACKQSGDLDATPISLTAIEQSNKTNQEKAELLAEAAEKIVLGPNFMDADRLFDRSLQYDPQNARARIYKIALGPLMLTKGLMTRITPLLPQLDSEDQARYQSAVDYLRKELKDSPATAFWFDGQPDIKNEEDIQNYVSQVQAAAKAARDFFAGLRDASGFEITLHPTSFTDKNLEEVLKKCSASVKDGVLTPYSCEGAYAQEWKMDYPDWEALRLIYAVYEYYYTGWNAYNIKGGYPVYSHLKKGPVTDREWIDLVQEQKDLGRLRDGEMLSDLESTAKEGVAAMKIAEGRQVEWCPNGTLTPANRPDALLSFGWCVDGNARSWTNLADRLLTGPASLALRVFSEFHGHRWQSGKYRTTVDVKPLFDGSLVNLQDLLPTQFDVQGRAINLPDGTLKGIFPKGDGIKVMQTQYPYIFRSLPKK